MIPTYEECMLPLLKLLRDGEVHKLNDVIQNLEEEFSLTEEEKRELLPSGKQAIFRNRVGWAKTYMKKAGLLETPKRAQMKISSRGIELLRSNPENLDSHSLMQFPEFIEFQLPKKKDSNSNEKSVKVDPVSSQTPEETLEYAYQELKEKLAIELINTVKEASPQFFENLVIDLLLRMGYGGSRKEAGETLGKSGDGGIDGIIKEDRLGLDIIYVQAKRWENPVPVREIRDFAGALLSKKARKGIFLTTSSFPKSAKEFVEKIEHKIILIDGERLADLMIENNVGLSVAEVYEVKRIDTDYFEEE